MNTNQLIGNAVAKATTFGTANVDTDHGDSYAGNASYSYAEGKDNTLTSEMLSKFYEFDKDALVDTDTMSKTMTAGWSNVASNKVQLDEAPTSADFAALNAFAKSAIQDVSKQRSDLGAIQNRLEHTISNLDNIVENTTSAESEIRDTDIATEMVRYSNNNILQQAGTSMLSQANQSNQLALSLLG
ncbi:MAG: hypothetical protein K2J04_13170 [Lachnospiraceae bacterium]|nr:hypothetical protein [Lachnospiraceae bacterium]